MFFKHKPEIIMEMDSPFPDKHTPGSLALESLREPGGNGRGWRQARTPQLQGCSLEAESRGGRRKES